jgi:cytochrome c-type biogenesis protein CcmH
MISRRRIALLATLALTATAVFGVTASSAAARPNLLSMESLFICTSCHEPLQLVSSPQAISEKQYIATLINEGEDRQQIINTMVAAYGVAVLAKPPAHGFNLVVYLVPPALVLAGLAFLVFTLPKWRDRSRRAAATALDAPEHLSDADTQRIDEELARLI